MYDPVDIAEITGKTVCENNRRKYYRFRPARFYGGISTADCVGCCLRCVFCWSWNIVARPEEHGLYTNYVTNGFITEEALDMIAPFLDVYRVDIKAFDEKTYMRTGHIKQFRGILDIAKKAKQYGMHVKVVTNVTPGFNDNETELRGIASWIKNSLGAETPWHVTRFYPQRELSHLSPTPVAVLEKAWGIGKGEGLWYVYLGNVPGHKLENTYCHKCGELLIERYVFEIVKNKIKDNKCPECGALIPGRF